MVTLLRKRFVSCSLIYIYRTTVDQTKTNEYVKEYNNFTKLTLSSLIH